MPEPTSQFMPFPARELVLRLASALVLANITLLATWSGPLPFAVLVAAVALILLWEWGRLTGGNGPDKEMLIGGAGVLLALAIVVLARPAWGIAVLVATAAATLVVTEKTERLMVPAGVLYAGLPSLALVWLRSDPGHGFASIVLLLAIVWATDSGAFVVGRLVGGPRLYPRVSPNKTWSGLLGGVTVAGAVAGAYASWVGSSAPSRVVILAVVLALVSQLGDLFESAMKRAHGVKDTSGLIPGHGGFMDRVDGLVFAAVVAAVFALLVDPGSPAQVLLGLR